MKQTLEGGPPRDVIVVELSGSCWTTLRPTSGPIISRAPKNGDKESINYLAGRLCPPRACLPAVESAREQLPSPWPARAPTLVDRAHASCSLSTLESPEDEK